MRSKTFLFARNALGRTRSSHYGPRKARDIAGTAPCGSCSGVDDLGDQSKVDHKAEHQAQLAAFERAGNSPEAAAEWLNAQVGLPLGAMLVKHPGVIEQVAARMRASRAQARQTRPPAPTVRWALAEGYEGIERAQLVVVNVRGAKEQERARALLAEVTRLRNDSRVFEDILGYCGSKIPITAVIADLSNAKDVGLKKALARVKRSVTRP